MRKARLIQKDKEEDFKVKKQILTLNSDMFQSPQELTATKALKYQSMPWEMPSINAVSTGYPLYLFRLV